MLESTQDNFCFILDHSKFAQSLLDSLQSQTPQIEQAAKIWHAAQDHFLVVGTLLNSQGVKELFITMSKDKNELLKETLPSLFNEGLNVVPKIVADPEVVQDIKPLLDSLVKTTEQLSSPKQPLIPQGHLGVLVCVEGSLPCFGTTPFSEIENNLLLVEKSFQITEEKRHDRSFHHHLHDLISTLSKQKRDEQTLKSMVIVSLWNAMNHPKRSQDVRDAVSAIFREHNFACINISIDNRLVWGLSVGHQAIDMMEVNKQIQPGDGNIEYVSKTEQHVKLN